MNLIPGKAMSIVLIAVMFQTVIIALVILGKISGDQFVSCFQFLVTTFFTGSALAAFRDSFGPGNTDKTSTQIEGSK